MSGTQEAVVVAAAAVVSEMILTLFLLNINHFRKFASNCFVPWLGN